MQLTIAASPHAVGPHNVADIAGNNHSIVFHRSAGPADTNLRPITISDDNSTIRNETEYPITLQASASGNTVVSFGTVTDLGSNNKVSRIRQAASDQSKPDSQENQYRIWTSTSDIKLLAKLIANKGGSVTLEKIDGVRLTGRLRDLTKADRAYLSDNAEKALLRTWTSTVGSKIKARLIRKQQDSVTLEKADSSRLTVRLNQLSKADRVYVDEH